MQAPDRRKNGSAIAEFKVGPPGSDRIDMRSKALKILHKGADVPRVGRKATK